MDDKRELVPFARGLHELGVELWATEGTAAHLRAAGVPVRAAEELTGIASWFGGRIKTLHPGLLGGILAPRTEAGCRELAARSLLAFDLVVSNLYPFERERRDHPESADLEEYVDIGGVTLTRAAAKNHAAVAIVTDPSQYADLLQELRAHDGAVSAATRTALARTAFERTAAYDAAIASGLFDAAEPFPSVVVFRRDPIRLRYGENPHQAAAVYRAIAPTPNGLPGGPLTQRKGDPLSFTNLLDLDTALGVVAEFSDPGAAVVKHATPCGAATAPTIGAAIAAALATDPVARYGCALVVNRPVAAADLAALKGVFVDLLGAPSIDPDARAALERRPKIKLVEIDPRPVDGWVAHSAAGRLLLEDADRRPLRPEELRPVTASRPTAAELVALEFAWRVGRHAKSNAIVLAQGTTTVGIGSGQTTRVKAVELAVEVAGPRARGSVLASDAFFPFADGIEAAGRAGVRAVIQPGGSVRDPEVIAAADRFGMAMVVTGWRAFRH